MIYDNPTFHKGYYNYDKGKYDKALKYIEKVLAENPEEVRSLCLKGLILHDYGYKEKSDECFNKIIEIYNKYQDNPNFKVIDDLNEIASEVGNDEHSEHGIIICDTILKIDNKNVKAYCEKGFSLNSLKRYNESIQCSDEGIKLDKYHRGVWYSRAIALSHIGNLKEAIKCCDELLSFNPYLSYVWSLMAGMTKNLGFVNDSQLYLKISLDLGYIGFDEQIQPIASRYFDFLDLYKDLKMKEEKMFSENNISTVKLENYKKNLSEVERLMRTLKPRLTNHPIKNDLNYHKGVVEILNTIINNPFHDFKFKSQSNTITNTDLDSNLKNNMNEKRKSVQKFCKGCGSKLKEDSNFCINCGLAIKRTNEEDKV